MRPSPMRRADIAFSKWIRERDGKCQAAAETIVACKGVLQCAHIIGRGEHSIRCDPLNAQALCSAHHLWYTHHTADWWEYIERTLPGRREYLWDRIQDHRAARLKVDWLAIAEDFA